jgi:sulfide:quinone oxidoreductase
MARVTIIGASIGGLPAAYEARALLDKQHKVTVISNVDSFHFVPSNPWVAVGWRTRKDISFAVGPVLEKKGIEFIHAAADRIEPEQNRVVTSRICGRRSFERKYRCVLCTTVCKEDTQAGKRCMPCSLC